MCSPFHSKCRCIFLLELDLDPSGLTGLEPAASALTGRCSDQLNYNPREIRCIAIAHIFLWFNSTHFYLEGPSYIIRETRVIYWLYTWLYTRICTLVITSNLFVIDKSIDNQSFNEKSIFFFLTLFLSLDFILTDQDMNLDH